MRRRFIPLSTPNLIGNESKYLKECVKTEWVSSSGKFVETFENKIKRIVGSKYAIACVNGTSALQLSLKLAGATSGDEVIVPSLTFIAPVNAVHYNNCSPIFMDSDEFFNIDVNKTIDFIKKFTKFDKGISVNKISKKKIVAIILVHVFGNAILMDKLIKLCKSRNIQIIEDASESLGTKFKRGIYKNKHTGSVGLLGCFSFNGNKIITSGGGGMIVTNNQKIAKRAKYLTTQAKDNADFFIHNDIGYNFRLTNLNAAVGLAQLEKLEKFIKIKKRIHKIYKKKINKIDGLRIAESPNYSNSNHWLNILIIEDGFRFNRNELIKILKEKKIETRAIWFPNHIQKPYFKNYAHKITRCINDVNKSLCLPSGTNLKKTDLNYICKTLESLQD